MVTNPAAILVRMRRAVWLLTGVALAFAQDLPPETLLLARIKVHMAEQLRRQPNYTCVELIERSRRPAGSRRYQFLDTLRLEVALVDGKELFAWPGARKFEEKRLEDIVTGGGAIGNGNFALHARAVFQSNAPTFRYAGETFTAGRRVARYTFRVPRLTSGYSIRMGEARETVGYEGSFAADADSLDLIHLEIVATEIPPTLPLDHSRDRMAYSRLPIGGAEFLLPTESELVMVDLAGNESRNRTLFSNCRQYSGESVLSFDDPPDAPSPQPAPKTELDLPADLSLELALLEPLDLDRAAIGDPVRARLARPLKHGKQVLFPKDAVATGRLRFLERHANFLLAGFTFESLESDSARASLRLALDLDAFLATPAGARLGTPRNADWLDAARRRGAFPVFGPPRLGRGFVTLWRTAPAATQEKP